MSTQTPSKIIVFGISHHADVRVRLLQRQVKQHETFKNCRYEALAWPRVAKHPRRDESIIDYLLKLAGTQPVHMEGIPAGTTSTTHPIVVICDPNLGLEGGETATSLIKEIAHLPEVVAMGFFTATKESLTDVKNWLANEDTPEAIREKLLQVDDSRAQKTDDAVSMAAKALTKWRARRDEKLRQAAKIEQPDSLDKALNLPKDNEVSYKTNVTYVPSFDEKEFDVMEHGPQGTPRYDTIGGLNLAKPTDDKVDALDKLVQQSTSPRDPKTDTPRGTKTDTTRFFSERGTKETLSPDPVNLTDSLDKQLKEAPDNSETTQKLNKT